MFKTNILTKASLLCTVSAILQLIPLFLSELFIIFTLLSTFPIYLITKKDYKLGFISYIATFVIISFFSLHEAIIFIFMNGLVGFTLGFFGHFIKNKYLVGCFSGLLLTSSIIFVSGVIGINVIGVKLTASVFLILGILTFSIIYCHLYHLVCSLLIKKVSLFQHFFY